MLPENKFEEFNKRILDSEDQSEAIEKDIEFLQKENQNLREEKNTERFCWMLSLIIMFDCWAFSSFENWGNSIVIGLLEIILLFITSRKLGITDITLITDKIVEAMVKIKTNNNQ
jgi:hypothetical protein